jgi:hypothetical protein
MPAISQKEDVKIYTPTPSFIENYKGGVSYKLLIGCPKYYAILA